MARTILRDDQWERIAPLLSGKAGDPGVTARDNRLFLEAVLWILRTGPPWRDLPSEFGPWHRVYVRYNRWSHNGRWEAILHALSQDPDLEYLMVDGSVTRVHQQGAPEKNSRLGGCWPLTRWPKHQNPCGLRCPGEPGEDYHYRRSSRRMSTRRRPDRRLGGAVRVGRQRL